MQRFLSHVDFSVLVDVISNVAGMMMIIACIALVVQEQDGDDNGEKGAKAQAKPITFPLAYIPEKRSVTVCLKNGEFYALPEVELMLAVQEKALKGEAIESLELTHDGVLARVEVTNTATGFRFLYQMIDGQGMPLNDAAALVDSLNSLTARYPPSDFFVVIHAWPDAYEELREIREFLQEGGMEVGWQQRIYQSPQEYDIYQAIGEYSQGLSSIKAQ